MAEDFLRWDGRPIPESQSVVTYLPYHERGDRIRIVRLEGKKEILLEDLGIPSEALLKDKSDIYVEGEWRHLVWTYNEKKECHRSPPTR